VLTDNAAAEVADEDVKRHVVVRVADEVVVDLMGRGCGLSYEDAALDDLVRIVAGLWRRVRRRTKSPRAALRMAGAVASITTCRTP
jgi:hypothetical protein